MKKQLSIPISLHSRPSGQGVHTTFGVPLPNHATHTLKHLHLFALDKNGDASPVNFGAKTCSSWPNGSLSWVELSLTLDERCHALRLDINEQLSSEVQTAITNTLSFADSGDTLQVTNGTQCFFIEKTTVALPQCNETNAAQTITKQNIELQEQTHGRYLAEGHHCKVATLTNPHSGQCIRLDVEITGQFQQVSNEQPSISAVFVLNYQFYLGSDAVKTELTVHNPSAAKHTAGQWDLGDPASLIISGLTVSHELDDASSTSLYLGNDETEDLGQQNWRLVQYSSGGKNWQSINHVNRHNQVSLAHQGAKLMADDRQLPFLRATPNVSFYDQQKQKTAEFAITDFWQRFPNSIAKQGNVLTFDFLPASKPDDIELQGGEKYYQALWLNLTKNSSQNLAWVLNPPRALVHTDNYATQHVTLCHNIAPAFAKLIDQGLSPKHGFFAKREQLDEFGWRHFGDVYADHETAGYSGEEVFVSHYNNQYDPILGFLRQWLRTGKTEWFELADDLAKHVSYIDIYHTQNDKAEYNGGLFWHTDHYLQAFTSSHRSYSKHQQSDVYQDHAGGGGPGGQHCYTSGLTYHYFLTGAQTSKQAVYTLTQWITHVYEGTNTLFELLLALKNRSVPGMKNQLTGQYPLDRGTANYVIALLDSFELSAERDYLQRVEHIIYNTVHPKDEIANRQLDNAEGTWFYTVFLQAIARYLETKKQQDNLDEHFYYARDCLLHYARWMSENEQPYLAKPEILEFPNDTWTAQDLRKAGILAAAWYFDPQHPANLLDKAHYFADYVANTLADSKERHYTRVLALLMQNSGSLEYYKKAEHINELQGPRHDWPAAPYTQSNMVRDVLKQLGQRLLRFSPKREYQWLQKRLGK
jgi:hypothetical protein